MKEINNLAKEGGGRSTDGAKILNEFGYNAVWLCGGTNKWLEIC
jgi:hypothetical protein